MSNGPVPYTTPGETHSKDIKMNATIKFFEGAIVPAVRVILR